MKKITKTKIDINKLIPELSIDVSKCNFISTPLTDINHQLKLKSDSHLKVALTKNLTQLFISELQVRIKLQKNVIMSIYGETGSGKSYAGMRIGELISNITLLTFNKRIPFEHDNDVHFGITPFLQRIHELGENTWNKCEILDEQFVTYGVGSTREQTDLLTLEAVVRKKQLHFIYISPELYEHIHHYLIEPWDIDYNNNLSRCILYDRMRFPLGFILLSKPDKEGLKKYSIKKDSFIDTILKGQLKDRYSMIEEISREFIKIPEFVEGKKDLRRLLVMKKYPYLTTQEVNLVLTQADHLISNMMESEEEYEGEEETHEKETHEKEKTKEKVEDEDKMKIIKEALLFKKKSKLKPSKSTDTIKRSIKK